MVVASVGHHGLGCAAWPAPAPADERDGIDQRDELGDVVAVAAGERDREWDTAALADQVVLGTGLASVDRTRSGRLAALFARMWEASTHARDQSISPAAFNSASSS